MRKKPKKSINKSQSGSVFITVNSPTWRQPQELDIKALGELLDLNISDVVVNISAVEFEDQDTSINRPPNTYPIDTDIKMAMDKNFLYVWVNGRWKRIPLSTF